MIKSKCYCKTITHYDNEKDCWILDVGNEPSFDDLNYMKGKMKNLYEVTFYKTKGEKNYFARWYSIHIEANTKKEAIYIAKQLWYGYSDAHMFRINAKKIELDILVDMNHWFTEIKC